MFKITFDDARNMSDGKDLDLIALDDALATLAAIDPQQSRIIELRYFGGMTIEDTAEVVGISPATVKREWSLAKVWLLREISRQEK